MPHIRITASGLSRTYELPETPRAETLVGAALYCQISLPEVKGLAPVQACIVSEPPGYVLVDMSAPAEVQGSGMSSRMSEPLEPGVVHRMGVISLMLEKEEPEILQVMPPQPQPVEVVTPSAHRQESTPPPVQVQIVMADLGGKAREERRPQKTSKFKRKEASLLLARFHRHKMHNAFMWQVLWLFLTLLMIVAVTCLAVRWFFPEWLKAGDDYLKDFIERKIDDYKRDGIPGVLEI